MPTLIRIATTGEVPADQGLTVKIDREEIAVFRMDGGYYACSARCPHAGGPLGEGFIDGTSVTCPWHGWSFELNCVGEPPRDGVERYKIIREGDELFVEIPD